MYNFKSQRFGSAPSVQQTAEFCQMCAHFFRQHPDQIIGAVHIFFVVYGLPPDMAGVHCTHGYNRTGFLIIAFLVEQDDWRYAGLPTDTLFVL